MPDLIEILESFNRKERFFLIAQALGQERADKPAFTLSENFRQELGKAVGLDRQGIAIPPDAFAAMDYHLNWVHASLVLACADEAERIDRLNTEAVEQNQEDVDLLVAFKDAGGDYHLIFIEAKGYNTDGMSDGLSDIDKDQLESKAGRLNLILKPDGIPYPNVKSHFCLMSGKKPTLIPPEWGNWLELSLPPERLVVRLKNPRILKSGKQQKGRPEKDRQIVPPKGQA